MTAATPTMAQSWARRLNFWNDQPAPSILRHADLGQDLVGLRGPSRESRGRIGGRNGSGPLRADRGEGGAEGQAGGGQVRGRVAVGDRATDGAPVAHLRVADLAGHVGQQRHVMLQHLADLEVAVAGQGADGHPIAVLPDVGQVGQPADVDQHRRARPGAAS